MQRVSVIGISGSGKTTVAERLAGILRCPHIELDAICRQAGWRSLDDAKFRAILDESTKGESWVVDGSYRDWVVEGPVWRQADTVVWVRLPKLTTLHQLLARSGRRVLCRQTLQNFWKGNSERLRDLLSFNAKRSIADVWTSYDAQDRQFANYLKDPRFAHINFVVLSSRAEVAAWLNAIAQTAGACPG
jgi:adenylate kinase family enzyme